MSDLFHAQHASVWIHEGQLYVNLFDLQRDDFDQLPTDPSLPVRRHDTNPNCPIFWTKTVDLQAAPVVVLSVYTHEQPKSE